LGFSGAVAGPEEARGNPGVMPRFLAAWMNGLTYLGLSGAAAAELFEADIAIAVVVAFKVSSLSEWGNQMFERHTCGGVRLCLFVCLYESSASVGLGWKSELRAGGGSYGSWYGEEKKGERVEATFLYLG
jgi:hypothetical protein